MAPLHPDLSVFAELLRRGYSRGDLEKIAGKNLLRAMKEMEAVAARLRRSERPALADVASRAATR